MLMSFCARGMRRLAIFLLTVMMLVLPARGQSRSLPVVRASQSFGMEPLATYGGAPPRDRVLGLEARSCKHRRGRVSTWMSESQHASKRNRLE